MVTKKIEESDGAGGIITAENFLEKCVPWTGFEKDLPAGVIGLPNTINILQLVKNVTIFDDNTDSGVRTIKYTELAKEMEKNPGMSVVNCEMWDERIKRMGINSIKITDPDGGKQLTMFDWFNSISEDGINKRQTNGLAMWALNKIRSKVSGPGVKPVVY